MNYTDYTHCAETGKLGYSSRAKAKTHIKRLKRHSLGQRMSMYVCPFCKMWHVTRQEQRAR